ncbi:thiamine-phosphate kinase [Helicobacter turcicus]|uniref:Thiamine-phosphate kinase n=1 Tax=Helicobacter turcicus TaxID=2867412 RepID=A0ABS7JPH4_9HELI|nr:thiamine-phosphate kinase [Helicobacter turcicus]MBX7491302.1 thiamine-phosphate kinase [Helicobacter turcicus]MBX7546211.1 thiamine-phosphate kinase [Helicobacter turcicus]
MQDREKAFIRALVRSNATFGIGDDGVEISNFVVANDAFFEDVHFKRAWGSLESIVEKCFVVNLSDIYAMNAIPRFCLLMLTLPTDFKEVGKLAKIIGNCALKHKVKIIGGDTIAGDKLHFSLTFLGQRQKSRILTRQSIKKGDILGYMNPSSVLTHTKTQAFGKNTKILKTALRFHQHRKIQSNTRFAKPILYPKMLLELNSIARAGMDISDGIFMELPRLSHLNRLGFKVFKPKGDWLYAPEEYQMLYAIPKNKLKKMQNFAKKHRHSFVPFAKAVRGKYRESKKNWHT